MVAKKSPVKRVAKSPAKPATKPVPMPVVVAVKAKHKLVRDSFTIPKDEYAVLAELKLRAGRLMRPAKKSEILRAGINTLRGMTDKALTVALAAVPSLKTGRPKRAEVVAAPVAVSAAAKRAKPAKPVAKPAVKSAKARTT